MSIMGTRVARTEDHKLITAGGRYVDDLTERDEPVLAGAAHAVFVRSPVAHARIGSIDTTAAADAPGVVAVLTAADLDLDPPRGRRGEPWLATDTVRYVGQPVALVITERRYQLADAAELVDVDYDPLPAVIDLDDAVAGGTLLFAGTDSNVVRTFGTAEFDESAFEDCEVVVSRRIVNQRVAAAPLEVRGAACAWGDDGRVTMWLSTQNPQQSRDTVAKGLGLDRQRVRIIAPDVGGGFGAKIGTDPESIVLAQASWLVGRALRWIETRSENFTAMTHGRGQEQVITIGGSRDGSVRAYRLDVVQDGGAYPRIGATLLPAMTTLMASGVYDIPRVEAAGRSVTTTTTPTAAYRGAGRPEATGAIERAIDLFAAEIGMDPAQLRRRNFIGPEQFPYTTPTGASYDTGEYAAALDRVLEAAGYERLRAEQARRREARDPVALGIGMSSYVEITAGDAAGESGQVTVEADGSVTVWTGSSPHGQGHATSFAMVLSDQLGVPFDTITIRHGDTDRVVEAVGTFGSRSLQLGGSALRQAGGQVIEQARELAAQLLEASADDIELVDGNWQVRGAPTSQVSWAQLGARAGDGGLSARTWYADAQPTFPFGAHLAVVEVDTETGKVALRRLVAVDDAGPVVNPITFDGQRHGGLAQGAAQALLEEMTYDGQGNPTTTGLADYEFISATELCDFELLDMATPTDRNPLGVKGVGEAATIGSTPAVQNAVVDALADLGVAHIDMPANPQRVWQAITDAKESASCWS